MKIKKELLKAMPEKNFLCLNRIKLESLTSVRIVKNDFHYRDKLILQMQEEQRINTNRERDKETCVL